MKQYGLSGKVALVTGAAGLLGPQWVTALQECGAKVLGTDIDLLRLRELEKNTGCEIRSVDVTSYSDISRVLHTFKPDILINNAALDPKVKKGGLVFNSRFETMSLAQWRKEQEVILEGTFLFCREFLNFFVSENKKGGTIVNIASELAVLAPDQRLYEKEGLGISEQNVKPVTYAVAKAGVVCLTKYLSTYPAMLDREIRINSFSPSGVFNEHPEDFVEKLSSRIPLNRMARIDEYRGAIQFLASEASSYMNGHNLIMDGGKSIW